MTDTKTMTAPVSLAEIKAKNAEIVCQKSLGQYTRFVLGTVPALVELAEAYIDAMPGIHDSCREQCKDPDACETKRQAARGRLALAAKQVRP